ncbi:YfjI family protein [Pseudomonas aeruginosa]|uniref:YfjI family protein n=1 Tax=Pseudomonas aeruginosa TaxID=287 RepID=UPI0029CAA51D|nr:YfjI family protein [Pseudomonas aeruginosa]
MKIPYEVPRIGAPFPLVLGLPVINSAVDDLERVIKAPRPLIFSAVLSAISLVLQGLVDVRKPKGGTSPCSLMLLCIADSGERKSALDKAVFKVVRELQNRLGLEHEDACARWQADFKIWEVKQRVIQRKIEKLTAQGEDSTSRELEYIAGAAREPKRPRKFKILYEDTTSEALFIGLHKDTPTAGLITSEGGGVLSGRALNDLSKQNSLWSGDDIHVDRATRESFTVIGGRLTVSVMVQERLFKEYMLKRGEIARGSGLWARFLVCKPNSTQGQRFDDGSNIPTPCFDVFVERLGDLLSRNVIWAQGNDWERNVVEFDDFAKNSWIHFYNFIEERVAEGGFWSSMRDHASKLADNIARLAALFHCFEGGAVEGKISDQTLSAAIQVGIWFSGEFAKIFSKEGRVEAGGVLLLQWLEDKCLKNGSHLMLKNDIRRYGPNRLRPTGVLDEVLLYLESTGSVGLESHANKFYVSLYPRGKVRPIGWWAAFDRGF